MVAAHKHDLRAAAQHGLKTAFIKRPHEYRRNNNPDLASEPEFTINAESFLDLADQLVDDVRRWRDLGARAAASDEERCEQEGVAHRGHRITSGDADARAEA